MLTRSAGLLLALLTFPACTGGPQLDDRLQRAIAIIEPLGDAVLRVKGYAALEKALGAKGAHYLPLIDTDHDKVITLAEVKAVANLVVNDPEFAAGLLAAAYLLKQGG